jgi:hypothetical protein
MHIITFALCFSFLLSFHFGLDLRAEVSVADPQNILKKSDEFLGSVDFTKNFVIGDKASYFNYTDSCQYSCDQGSCSSICETKQWETLRQVYACEETKVTLGSDDGSFYLELTKEYYQSFSGNFARLLISHLDDQIKVTGHVQIQKFTVSEYKIEDKQNNSQSIESFSIFGDYIFEDGNGRFPFVVSIGKNLPSIAQIVRLRIGDQTWYRLKGIK